MDILWLDRMGMVDRSMVGGKAANLAALASAYRVPLGFCVTTDAVAMVTTGDGEELPPALRERIAAAYRELGERAGMAEPRVAVRSSAADEDGSAASFAGQHETYLNIVGADAVAAAVARCLASAHSERSAAYRRLHGLASAAGVAVLVQLLIPADVSAVVFSADPVSGERDHAVINASWGLGESIVGGTVTPDTYRVDKADGTIHDRQIADKRRMTISVPDGTAEVEVPRLLRAQPALTAAEAAAMAALAASLERSMGWPVDIECAIHGGHLYLLQCRPITTLARAASAVIGLSRPPAMADAAGG